MKFRLMTAAVAVAVAGSALSGAVNPAPVQAAPQQTSPDASKIGWTVDRVGAHSVALTVDAGSIKVDDGRVVVRDAAGAVRDVVPTAIAANGKLIPSAAHVAGRTVTLTPNPAAATPFRRQVDLNSGVAGIQGPITLTAAMGSYLGAAAGAITGCLLGATVAAIATTPVALLFGAGPLGGCIAGAVFLGATAGVLGGAAGGIGSGVANLPRFIELLNKPAAPTKSK